jgi:hypothetical protein
MLLLILAIAVVLVTAGWRTSVHRRHARADRRDQASRHPTNGVARGPAFPAERISS